MAEVYGFNSEEDIKRIRDVVRQIEAEIKGIKAGRTARPVVITRDFIRADLTADLLAGEMAEAETTFGDTIEVHDDVLDAGKMIENGSRIHCFLDKSEGTYWFTQAATCPVDQEEEEE